jgi:hypothetical protein
MSIVFGGGDPIFDTKPRQVSWLLGEIEKTRIGLPDFQRDFVWDPSATLDLLVSLMARFPAGALLTLKQTPAKESFKPRAFELAPPLNDSDPPTTLVLDGQQRLTALYQALRGVGDTRFLVDLTDFVDTDSAIDIDALDFETIVLLERAQKDKSFESTSEQWQFANWRFPVHRLLNGGGFESWVESAVTYQDGDLKTQARRRLRLVDVKNTLLGPLATYSFPVVELPEETSLVAVCKIFETLNLTGVKLSVFELLTARFWAYGENLRDLWDQAQTDHPILGEFSVDPYSVLQTITLRTAGSAQRSDVIRLRTENITAHWDGVIRSFVDTLEHIRDQFGVKTEKWMPYAVIVVPIAGAWDVIEGLQGMEQGAALKRLEEFFWCSVFMANYDQGANSQAQADYKALRWWLADPNQPAPEAVADFNFTTSQLAAARINRRALYRGTMALTMNAGAVDFHKRLKLTHVRIAEQEIDAHHLFPRRWLEKNYVGRKKRPEEAFSAELIANRALIDKETNQRIGANAPSVYLKKIRANTAIGPHLGKILMSHLVNTASQEALERDDYEAFIKARTNALADAIDKATGQTVTRDL